MRAILSAVATCLLMATVSDVARAQSAAQLSLSREPAARFVGLDVFAGGGQITNVLVPATDTEEAKYPKWGWDAGATVNVGLRWLGLTAAVGRQPIDETLWVTHVVAGPRVTSPWMVSDTMVGRFFAHALVGAARADGPVAQTAGELVVGGGMDLLFFLRIQGDYVRTNLQSVKRGNGRLFIGAVIPLCAHGCTQADGFNVSGRPAVQ